MKVQRFVDRKIAQVIAGHTQHPPGTAYQAVNHQLRKVVCQYTINEHFGIFAWHHPQPYVLIAFIFSGKEAHRCLYNNLCCSCKKHLVSDTLLWTFYHALLKMYIATTLLFDWLKSLVCNKLLRNKLSLQPIVKQRDVVQPVVAVTSCLATSCRQEDVTQRVGHKELARPRFNLFFFPY